MSVESSDNFLENPFNRIEILLEEMSGRIQTLAEGVAMNTERIQRLDAKIEVLQDDVTDVKNRLLFVEQDVSIIKKTFATKKDLLPMKRDITKLNKVVFA